MGFDRRENAKRCTPLEGDTLRHIAERVSAAGNPITWQELAQFNWGTTDEAEINAFLRDELGARRRDADNNFVLSPDDEPRGHILIPEPFVRQGLTAEKTYKLRVRRRTAPPQFLECCHIPGITFALNSSFVRPNVAGYLKKLEMVARRHPDARIMIFGHTDASGEELYNKKLSERRAWSVYAFITDDPDAWEVLYNHPDEHWGLAVIQEILDDLGHNPGPPDGDWGPQTRAAMRAFLNLPEDAPVVNDAAFRRQLFAQYMASKHDVDLPPERFMNPGYMGCGEFNLVLPEEGQQGQNRRVTFFFFHPDRIPRLPCAFADLAPCTKQMVSEEHRHKAGFRCSFFDSLSVKCAAEGPVQRTSSVFLLDERGERIPRAPWRALVGTAVVGDGTADEAGLATIESTDLPEVIELQWSRPGMDLEGTHHFSRAYRTRVPESGEEACAHMLANLGFDYFDDLALSVEAFQRELGLTLTGAYQDIEDLLAQWHGTGNRPEPEGAGSDTDEQDGAVAAGEEGNFEDELPLEDDGEPLHPDDVLDVDHNA